MKKHISLSLLLFVALTGFAWADKTIETLPSGVKVEHLKPGTGASPTAADTVVAHYRGTLLDGKEFDSSYKRGEPKPFLCPASFRVGPKACKKSKSVAKPDSPVLLKQRMVQTVCEG